MVIFIVESEVCCLNLFEKCSSHQLLQTFQKVFTMQMSLQYHSTLLDSQTASIYMAAHCRLFCSSVSERSNCKVAEDTLFHAAPTFCLSKQSNFSCLFPVVSESLLLCKASSGPMASGAYIGISSCSCQLRTKKHFPFVFRNISISLYPA